MHVGAINDRRRGVGHTIVAVLAWAGLLLAACSGGDDDTGGPVSTGPDDGQESTTSTVPPDYQALVEARREAQRQYEQARANPTNPENPVLRDHFTDVALMNMIEGQVFGNAENGNGQGWVYPEGSQHRFEIESATFSESDPTKAWLEVCEVDDSEIRYLRTGERADVTMSILEVPPIRTVQWTEEMWKVDGRWKVARRFENTNEPGVVGCAVEEGYEKDYRAADADPGLTPTITEQREAAEAAYVEFLIDPASTAWSGGWTGFQNRFYFANPGIQSDDHLNVDDSYCPGDVTLINTGSAAAPTYEQFYLIDDAQNPWRTNPYYMYPGDELGQSPCYADYQLGQSSWAFSTRNDGRIFDVSTYSVATVESVQLQAVEDPHVAYLTTCRSYKLTPTWEGDFSYLEGRVEAVEVMHLVDGTWTVSNRWGFAAVEAC